MCQCEDRVVQRLEQDFKSTLQQQNSLEQWASWLDGVVSQALKPYENNPTALPKAAKAFLLNWSFYRLGQELTCDIDVDKISYTENYSFNMVFSYQFYGDPGLDSTQRCKFWLFSPDPSALR